MWWQQWGYFVIFPGRWPSTWWNHNYGDLFGVDCTHVDLSSCYMFYLFNMLKTMLELSVLTSSCYIFDHMFNKTIFVVLLSPWGVHPTRGVPQGSILGPMLVQHSFQKNYTGMFTERTLQWENSTQQWLCWEKDYAQWFTALCMCTQQR